MCGVSNYIVVNLHLAFSFWKSVRLMPCLIFNHNLFDLTSIAAPITAGITSTEHVRSDYFVVSAVAL